MVRELKIGDKVVGANTDWLYEVVCILEKEICLKQENELHVFYVDAVSRWFRSTPSKPIERVEVYTDECYRKTESSPSIVVVDGDKDNALFMYASGDQITYLCHSNTVLLKEGRLVPKEAYNPLHNVSVLRKIVRKYDEDGKMRKAYNKHPMVTPLGRSLVLYSEVGYPHDGARFCWKDQWFVVGDKACVRRDKNYAKPEISHWDYPDGTGVRIDIAINMFEEDERQRTAWHR